MKNVNLSSSLSEEEKKGWARVTYQYLQW
jgi:hypothetical protein